MNHINKQLQDLSEIRAMMEKSSKFLSLSGLSGICAGTIALVGAGVAWWYLNLSFAGRYETAYIPQDFLLFFIGNAGTVLFISIAAAMYFTYTNARRKHLPFWNAAAKQMVIGLAIPLVSGGLFCLSLYLHHAYGFIAPAMLIFYGLALINGGRFTVGAIRSLGITEIVLGCTAAFLPNNGLLFWAIGFGLLHIVYGVFMYYRYERN